MNLTAEIALNPIPVTIIHMAGDLDAATYQEVIAFAKQHIQEGAKNLLLDISEMRFMSSSGLVALYSIVTLLRGSTPPNPEEGWNALHAVSREVEKSSGFEKHLKILQPQPRVAKTLTITGFDKFIEVFTDQQAALASFTE
ncbi:MAG: STAS domain-containing protein [Anaerolineales bacterium]|nr:STAS domain-containing protein [Anaerolineales bacterium]